MLFTSNKSLKTNNLLPGTGLEKILSISGLLAVKMYHKEYISNVVLKWVLSLILWFKPILSVLSLHSLVSNFILISWPTLFFHMYSRLRTYFADNNFGTLFCQFKTRKDLLALSVQIINKRSSFFFLLIRCFFSNLSSLKQPI